MIPLKKVKNLSKNRVCISKSSKMQVFSLTCAYEELNCSFNQLFISTGWTSGANVPIMKATPLEIQTTLNAATKNVLKRKLIRQECNKKLCKEWNCTFTLTILDTVYVPCLLLDLINEFKSVFAYHRCYCSLQHFSCDVVRSCWSL